MKKISAILKLLFKLLILVVNLVSESLFSCNQCNTNTYYEFQYLYPYPQQLASPCSRSLATCGAMKCEKRTAPVARQACRYACMCDSEPVPKFYCPAGNEVLYQLNSGYPQAPHIPFPLTEGYFLF